MYLYLRGKAQDGIRGDNGMTISGGVKQLRERGCCLESTFPYPGRYVQSIPTGADAEAAKYKLGAAVDVTASGDVYCDVCGSAIDQADEEAMDEDFYDDYYPGDYDMLEDDEQTWIHIGKDGEIDG